MVGSPRCGSCSSLRIGRGRRHSSAGYASRSIPRRRRDRLVALVDRGHVALVEGRSEAAAGLLRDALALWRGRPLMDLGCSVRAGGGCTPRGASPGAIEDRIQPTSGSAKRGTSCPSSRCRRARAVPRAAPRSAHARARPLQSSGGGARLLSRGRRLSAEELGIEPSPELQALERAILQQEPSLLVPVEAGRPAWCRRRLGVAVAAAARSRSEASSRAVLALRAGSSRATPSSATLDSVAVIDPGLNRLVDVIPVRLDADRRDCRCGRGVGGEFARRDAVPIDPGARRVMRTIGLERRRATSPLASARCGSKRNRWPVDVRRPAHRCAGRDPGASPRRSRSCASRCSRGRNR